MLGYVETVQRKEGKHKVDQLLHQKWSGANYIDKLLLLVNNDTKVLASAEESTEHQFEKSGQNEINTPKNQGTDPNWL